MGEYSPNRKQVTIAAGLLGATLLSGCSGDKPHAKWTCDPIPHTASPLPSEADADAIASRLGYGITADAVRKGMMGEVDCGAHTVTSDDIDQGSDKAKIAVKSIADYCLVVGVGPDNSSAVPHPGVDYGSDLTVVCPAS